ncbi:acyl-CoA dehydrogenase family protein [Rhodococcus wratislaviensis]|uniref:Putative acyl-CoA dehydrogenase n=1 Tax=Rhodococcus wratislaviensis NBRC 100605 TaxID=1219028 RepID=X0R304_RHOWR|nr:acyl-CoA dehydrogenase family protein [Rhodococcus wratislaviensis]GAF45290.1 putative acyl-CoA dehydrogenase [Rhodococcus wratislaviensis NBRC 100605]
MGELKVPQIEEFLDGARQWLSSNVNPWPPRGALVWGSGLDKVSLFRDSCPEEERAQIDAVLAWQRAKFDAGYGAISYPPEYGGAGLPRAYESAFRRLERSFAIPAVADVASISLEIEAPTILTLGTEEQKRQWLPKLRRGDLLCCQLFSEPGAGSDLGSIALRANRAGDDWILDGQKVWTSGAQFADLGYVICRTSKDVDNKTAFTAFVVPMDTPGVTVRPLRQMTGGACFNEVFFDGVRVSDTARIGEVGGGWKAMMTTLGFERASAAEGGGGAGPDVIGRMMMTAQHQGLDSDPLVRQSLADVYAVNRMRSWTSHRAAANAKAGVPGPEGSISKLTMTRWMQSVSELATTMLGPSLVADTGEWGTFAWSEFVCSFPGVRLGGGTDEIQKNTIAERALGLPREPRQPAPASATGRS